jgi:chromosome segregation ATPase
VTLIPVKFSVERGYIYESMALRETLQAALVNANNERIALHARLQEHDLSLWQVSVHDAEAEKASVAEFHAKADGDYRELLTYVNSRTDENERNSLMPEVERLARAVNASTMALHEASEKARGCQSHLAQRQAQRAAIEQELNRVTQRWEAIRQQIEGFNKR